MGALDDYNEEYKQAQRDRIIDLERQNARLKKYIKDRSRYIKMLTVRERHVESRLAELQKSVSKIRKHDSGSWMKDCTGGLFRCSDGFEDRCKLGRLLNDLYKTAGI